MKITVNQLRRIIKEEVSSVVNEAPLPADLGSQGFEYIIGDLLLGKPLKVSDAFLLASMANQPMDGIISALYDDPKYSRVAKRLERELLKREG